MRGREKTVGCVAADGGGDKGGETARRKAESEAGEGRAREADDRMRKESMRLGVCVCVVCASVCVRLQSGEG